MEAGGVTCSFLPEMLKATKWDLDVWFSLKLMEIGCPDLQADFKSCVSIYN